MSSKVFVKFPKAGLGNMLLTWSRGYIFANLNNLELFTSSWTRIHAGAWLRRERKKRLYKGYFKEKSVLKSALFFFSCMVKKKIHEPPVEKIANINGDTVYIFDKIFTDYDFFKEVRPYRKMVRDGLYNQLQPSLQIRLESYEKPEIGIHIRRGDFTRGSTLTPLSFFIEVVNGIRQQIGIAMPVTLFTDAKPGELKELLDLPFVSLAEQKEDILDIFLLARSRIVVLSIGSSFSYWAAFLSEGIIIKHPGEWHTPFRSESDPMFKKEIKWNSELKINDVINQN